MPYLGVAETSTTITCTFDSGDAVVWTISDEDAVLKEGDNPLRAVIHENYFEWTVYDTYMLRWQHDTAASTTGIAFDSGNSYCTDANKVQIGSYDYYLYPATSTVNTNKMTYAAELADISITQNTGSAVTDRNWPGKIASGTSGACYDGAFHVTSDSNNAGKFTMDRARALFAFVLEEWEHKSGDPSSPTEHCTFHDKMDSIADGHTPAIGTGTVTVAGSPTLENGTQGNGVLCDASSDYFRIASSGNMSDISKGCITFDYIDVGTLDLYESMYIFFGHNNFRLRHDSHTQLRLHEKTFTGVINIFDGLVHSVMCNWDYDASWCQLVIDGVIQGSGDPGIEPTFTYLYIGNDSGSDSCQGIIDNFKIYNTPILPYGTLIPANIISGDVGYDMAHSDILFYWDCAQDALRIGTGSVTTETGDYQAGGPTGNYLDNLTSDTNSITATGHIDPSAGSISFWFNLDTIAADYIFRCEADASNEIYIRVDAGDSTDYHLIAAYQAGGTTELLVMPDNSMKIGNWYHVRLTWGSGYCSLWCDGVLHETEAIAGTWAGTLGTMYIMCGASNSYECDGKIAGVTITSNPNTPQLFTANGKPLILPDFKSEVA